jgi:hypothetical protein
MHGFQQIVTQAKRRYNVVVHGLPPLGMKWEFHPECGGRSSWIQ